MSYGIYETLKHYIGSKVNILHPDLSSLRTLFDLNNQEAEAIESESSREYIETIKNLLTSNNAKKIVTVINSNPLSEDDNANDPWLWIGCVIVPQLNNHKSDLHLFDTGISSKKIHIFEKYFREDFNIIVPPLVNIQSDNCDSGWWAVYCVLYFILRDSL